MSVALVTGGTQGIGLGIAEALAAAGFSVAIAAELPEDAPAVGEALARLGPGTRYHRHDLREVEGVERLLDAVGPVDCLVQNAGVPARLRGDLLEMTPENWDWTLGVNLRGAFFLAQGVARRMLAAAGEGYRSLLLVTSVSAEMASPERGEYCVSKAGLSMAAKLLALRLAPHGIGVFELRPGVIDTPMTAGVRDRWDARIAEGLVPMGRWGAPSDIAGAALACAQGHLAFATGTVLAVDGGLSIPRL